MTVRLGILAQLEAAPGKGEELAAFLRAGQVGGPPRALAEAGEAMSPSPSVTGRRRGYRGEPGFPGRRSR